jgi:Mlc titration factor MtfA (ptsG expression regulator)
MNSIFVLLGCVASVFLFFVVRATLTRRRRNELLKLRLTNEQRLSIIEDFPLFSRLPDDVREELEGIMHVFIDEKSFEPCGGLESVDEYMRLVISAQACLLLVNRKHDYYRALRSILLYPTAYKARDEHGDHDVRLGESWGSGSVVLAWDSVVAGGVNEEDGHHVTLHEFAHQLDQVDGAADGVPELTGSGSYREWSSVFSKAYDKFTRKLDRGKRTVIDGYGATNPAEFFAVATETFYEKPEQLNEQYPEVYQQLKNYYRVDPLEWI